MSKNKGKGKKAKNEDVSEHEDSMDGLDLDESEPETKPKKKTKKSAQDDDDTVKTKSAKKKTKKAAQEDDDNSDGEIKPKKAAKKSKKDVDSDDSDIEVKPNKNAKGKGSTKSDKKPSSKSESDDDVFASDKETKETKKSKTTTKKEKSGDDDDVDDSSGDNEKSLAKPDYKNTKVKLPVYRYKQINFNNLTPSKINDSGQQPMAFLNYVDDKLKSEAKPIIQSDFIVLKGGGVPRLDLDRGPKSYYPTDEKREFCRVPLDPEQKNCVRFRKFLEKGDEYFESIDFKTKLFGKKHARYVYRSMIKSPMEQEDDDKKPDPNKRKYPQYDKARLKFACVYVDKNGAVVRMEDPGAVKVMAVKLVRLDPSGKNGVVVKATKVQEIADEINGAEIRFVFTLSKVWISATPMPQVDKKAPKMFEYGVGLKVIAIEYKPRLSTKVTGDNIEFISGEESDSGENSDGDTKSDSGEGAKKKAKQTTKKKKSDETSDVSEEVKPKKKKTAKSANKDDE